MGGLKVGGPSRRTAQHGASRWGVKEGDLVALEEYLPCGHCDYCRTGEYRSCMSTDHQRLGAIRYGSTPIAVWPSLWGGYSHYLYLRPRSVFHKVPPGIPPHIAAMALPIGNGFQWICLDAGAGPGKVVVIQGPGQQGLGCVIAAKAAGADTIILSGLKRDADRFAVAQALGATHTIAVDEEDLLSAVARITDGRMADIVVEVSGSPPDVTNITQLPHDEIPHAFGFIYRQIMLDDAIPSVPVILSTFYPPNQPTVERCCALGESLIKAIELWDDNARVALIASGGLTHFVIDEEVDRAVLSGMRHGDVKEIAALGESVFQDGTSEVKNWISVASAIVRIYGGRLRALLSLRSRHRECDGIRLLAALDRIVQMECGTIQHENRLCFLVYLCIALDGSASACAAGRGFLPRSDDGFYCRLSPGRRL